MTTAKLYIYVPKDTLCKVKDIAKKNNISVSEAIRRGINTLLIINTAEFQVAVDKILDELRRPIVFLNVKAHKDMAEKERYRREWLEVKIIELFKRC